MEAQGSKKAQPRRKSQAQFTCSFCGKEFNRRIRLVEHERVHTGERPFKCDMCEATFSQRANWRNHMQKTHLNVANYKCNLCERQFKQRRLLTNHIKSVHTKLRDLSCDLCDAKFCNPVNLKNISCATLAIRTTVAKSVARNLVAPRIAMFIILCTA